MKLSIIYSTFESFFHFLLLTLLSMLVHRSIDAIPSFKNAVMTIGTFDGVHLGHQKIIEQLKKEAIAVNGETVLITFDPHPRSVIHARDIHILNTLNEKIELLQQAGIDHVVVIPFTEVFADQTAMDYVQNFLVKIFAPHTIVIGYDHKFGKNRSGNYTLLESLSSKYNFRVKEIPQQILQEASISSTTIREALTNHNIAKANALLGYSYFFEGKVIEGDKRGRSIGFPTANLLIDNIEKLIPSDGVYAVTAYIVNNPSTMIYRLKGMMNIGVRPTINEPQHTIEVHLFDFDENIYEKYIRVYVHQYLRSEQKFDGLEMLKAQLLTDKTAALIALNQ